MGIVVLGEGKLLRTRSDLASLLYMNAGRLDLGSGGLLYIYIYIYHYNYVAA